MAGRGCVKRGVWSGPQALGFSPPGRSVRVAIAAPPGAQRLAPCPRECAVRTGGLSAPGPCKSATTAFRAPPPRPGPRAEGYESGTAAGRTTGRRVRAWAPPAAGSWLQPHRRQAECRQAFALSDYLPIFNRQLRRVGEPSLMATLQVNGPASKGPGPEDRRVCACAQRHSRTGADRRPPGGAGDALARRSATDAGRSRGRRVAAGGMAGKRGSPSPCPAPDTAAGRGGGLGRARRRADRGGAQLGAAGGEIGGSHGDALGPAASTSRRCSSVTSGKAPTTFGHAPRGM